MTSGGLADSLRPYRKYAKKMGARPGARAAIAKGGLGGWGASADG